MAFSIFKLSKNKVVVKELTEAKQVIKQLNVCIENSEPRKEYSFAIYK